MFGSYLYPYYRYFQYNRKRCVDFSGIVYIIVNVTWVRKMCGLFWYCIMSESSLESTCGPRAMSGLSTIPVMIACSVLILGIYLTWLDAWTDAFIKSLSSSTAYCQSYDIHELYDVQDPSIISEGVSPFIKPSRVPAEITFIMHVGWYISSFVWRRDYNTLPKVVSVVSVSSSYLNHNH